MGTVGIEKKTNADGRIRSPGRVRANRIRIGNTPEDRRREISKHAGIEEPRRLVVRR